MLSQHSIHRNVQLAVVIALFFLTAIASQAQVGLGMSPMRVEMRMSAGAQYSGALNLSNTTDSKLRVRTELLDFFIDASDTPQFNREWKQESAFSCRKWLTVNPMEIEADPSSQVLARYTIRVPEGTPAGSYHCAAGFSTLPLADEVVGTGMHMAVRVVSAFYVVVGKTEAEGSLKGITLERLAAKDKSSLPEFVGVVTLANPSAMYFRPQGQLDLLDGTGRVVETVEMQQLPVLPKRDQRFLFHFKSQLDQPQYTLRARVDIGNGVIQEGTTTVTLK